MTSSEKLIGIFKPFKNDAKETRIISTGLDNDF